MHPPVIEVGGARATPGNRAGPVVRVVVAAIVLIALAAAYRLLQDFGVLQRMLDPAALRSLFATLDPWGPFVIAGLVALAVVISPIPSAPVALASGAMYGHAWGTLYVVVGAELGAIVAFGIARVLGHGMLRRWLGDRVQFGWLGSQNALTWLVFVSRLAPFISFDLVSYAAGLTALAWWRFALATLGGVVPAAFFLAHIGGEMTRDGADRAAAAALLLGAAVLVPAAFKLLQAVRRNRNAR